MSENACPYPQLHFSVPAVFKGYIDQIVRVGRTFSFDPEQPEPDKGLIEGKTVVVVAARGDAGYGPEGPNWSKNHLEPYVSEVFRFLGVENIKTVAVESDECGGMPLRESFGAAEATLRHLAAEVGAGARLNRCVCAG